jgi:hypothetical protein
MLLGTPLFLCCLRRAISLAPPFLSSDIFSSLNIENYNQCQVSIAQDFLYIFGAISKFETVASLSDPLSASILCCSILN